MICMSCDFLCLSVMFLYVYLVFFFFFKQKTAYEMRISDWSSDVCSSDLMWIIILITYLMALGDFTHIVVGSAEVSYLVFAGQLSWEDFWMEIGRASCRERVCQYV